jgi:hypothetical protein
VTAWNIGARLFKNNESDVAKSGCHVASQLRLVEGYPRNFPNPQFPKKMETLSVSFYHDSFSNICCIYLYVDTF